MAIYHFEAKVITRGTGRSVVAAAAYASCSEIYNDYDGIAHDYTRKRGYIYSEIFLPPNAPNEWQDRSELWNAVEAAEKSKDSRLARELIVALPVELKIDDWKSILKDFITTQCVNKGMCADVSIHDTDGHNPHAHILLTVRPLDDNGKWQAKTQKEYLCKRGDEEFGFTSTELKAAHADGWEKQYQYFVGKKKVYMPPSEAKEHGYERASKNPKSTRYGRQNPICAEWNSDEQILHWRKAWEDVTNQALEKKRIDERVDCRSFTERGIDEQPTIHEGVTARIMEKQGFISEKCELNRQIKADNKLLRELKAVVKKLTDTVKKTVPVIAATLEAIRNKLVVIQYQLNFNSSQCHRITSENSDISRTLNNYKAVKTELLQKNKELKKLKSEKKSLHPIHILQHNDLSKRITTLTEDIEELKNRKNLLLVNMRCNNDNQVAQVEKRIIDNTEVIGHLTERNIHLNEEKETEKSHYKEVSDNIAPEDVDAVQLERINIRNDTENTTIKLLQETYGDKYSYKDFRIAAADVRDELGEKPLPRRSIRKALKKNKAEQSDTHKRSTDEPEL
jgi:hypothetical protein